ncbi:aminotransferase [Westerdykella ornata]|uniref:Aminotransferase n=1 Tax=Westerdykella ornata TaxID=318751 RepID=A0A6A6JMG7_WESOR|nr:aminotransferase [Westerdykella ornata]KAF2277791.1 aminotransferase [Westerdykella ornata]
MSATLSVRGAKADKVGSEEAEIWNVLSNLYNSESNPDGYISLGVAENALGHQEMRDFINSKKLIDPAARALTYGDGPSGSKPVRKALASFFNDYFQPAKPVHMDNIMVTNGVTSAIEHTAWALANPGDGILLGRPYYRAFLPDISHRTGVKVVRVAHGKLDPLGPECVAKYEEALLESRAKGVEVPALMLCHPHNPLGRCYSTETIIALMKFCQKYKIHLISDEIYALSIFPNTAYKLDKEPIGFNSVLSIDTSGIIDPELVHVLWGISKDFGGNGIRLGVILSQSNNSFLTACRTASLNSVASSLAENAVVEILNDRTFLNSYIEKNRQRLSEAHAYAIKVLKSYSIPYEPGVNAAFFLWVNLGTMYAERHPEVRDAEDPHAITSIIFKKLMEKKVFLVHGEAAGAEEPGWFRMVFTQPKGLIEEGIRRISEAINDP